MPFAAVNGVNLYYELHGDSGEPLVLVHGEPQAQQTLKSLVAAEFNAPVHVADAGDSFDLMKPVPF